MTVRGSDRHGIRVFDTVDDLVRYIEDIARVDHPERYAPDGTPLRGVRSVDTSWAGRLRTWHHVHDPEPEVPDDGVEVAHADADLTRPVPYWTDDHDEAVVPPQNVVAPNRNGPRSSSVDDIPV